MTRPHLLHQPARPRARGPSSLKQRPSWRERGSASIQMVLLMPALFSVMFLGMQAALHYHARTIAIAAAQEGARTAGAENGTATAGVAAATSYVTDTGGDALTEPTVTGTRTATTASVTVRGVALSVIPGWRPTINQSATVPVERITG